MTRENAMTVYDNEALILNTDEIMKRADWLSSVWRMRTPKMMSKLSNAEQNE